MKTSLRKPCSTDFKAHIIDLFNLGKTVPQLAEELGHLCTEATHLHIEKAI